MENIHTLCTARPFPVSYCDEPTTGTRYWVVGEGRVLIDGLVVPVSGTTFTDDGEVWLVMEKGLTKPKLVTSAAEAANYPFSKQIISVVNDAVELYDPTGLCVGYKETVLPDKTRHILPVLNSETGEYEYKICFCHTKSNAAALDALMSEIPEKLNTLESLTRKVAILTNTEFPEIQVAEEDEEDDNA